MMETSMTRDSFYIMEDSHLTHLVLTFERFTADCSFIKHNDKTITLIRINDNNQDKHEILLRPPGRDSSWYLRRVPASVYCNMMLHNT